MVTETYKFEGGVWLSTRDINGLTVREFALIINDANGKFIGVPDYISYGIDRDGGMYLINEYSDKLDAISTGRIEDLSLELSKEGDSFKIFDAKELLDITIPSSDIWLTERGEELFDIRSDNTVYHNEVVDNGFDSSNIEEDHEGNNEQPYSPFDESF